MRIAKHEANAKAKRIVRFFTSSAPRDPSMVSALFRHRIVGLLILTNLCYVWSRGVWMCCVHWWVVWVLSWEVDVTNKKNKRRKVYKVGCPGHKEIHMEWGEMVKSKLFAFFAFPSRFLNTKSTFRQIPKHGKISKILGCQPFFRNWKMRCSPFPGSAQ